MKTKYNISDTVWLWNDFEFQPMVINVIVITRNGVLVGRDVNHLYREETAFPTRESGMQALGSFLLPVFGIDETKP